MSFDSLERSIESSLIAELYICAAPAFTYYLTSSTNDIVYGGQTYKATNGARSNALTVDLSSDASDVTFTIPIDHALVNAYAPGIPVAELEITIIRYQIAGGAGMQIWQGYVSGMSLSGELASFRVPSGTADTLLLNVPGVLATRACNNVLYDNQCTIVRASYTITTTILGISADGKTIGVSSMAGLPGSTVTGWATHGDILHNLSTERRTITLHTGPATLTLQCAFPNGVIHVGDVVSVAAGCDHQLDTGCGAKFNNAINYTGVWALPVSNVFYVGLDRAVTGTGN